MKTDTLKEQVKDFYTSQNMPPESLARIKSRISEAGLQRPKTRPRGFLQSLQGLSQWSFRIRIVPAMAAALTVFVMINMTVWYQWHRTDAQGVSARVAHEIATTHAKNLQPEIQVASIEGLQKVMPSLDFKPYTPDEVKRLGLVMEGARYCSIQGYLAVHMQFKDASGKSYSVYQAPCPPPLQKLKRTVVELDNFQIIMWRENGFFVGIARPENPSWKKISEKREGLV